VRTPCDPPPQPSTAAEGRRRALAKYLSSRGGTSGSSAPGCCDAGRRRRPGACWATSRSSTSRSRGSLALTALDVEKAVREPAARRRAPGRGISMSCAVRAPPLPWGRRATGCSAAGRGACWCAVTEQQAVAPLENESDTRQRARRSLPPATRFRANPSCRSLSGPTRARRSGAALPGPAGRRAAPRNHFIGSPVRPRGRLVPTPWCSVKRGGAPCAALPTRLPAGARGEGSAPMRSPHHLDAQHLPPTAPWHKRAGAHRQAAPPRRVVAAVDRLLQPVCRRNRRELGERARAYRDAPSCLPHWRSAAQRPCRGADLAQDYAQRLTPLRTLMSSRRAWSSVKTTPDAYRPG